MDDVAERLRTAYRTGLVPPLRDALDSVDSDGASAVQAINTRIWRDTGRRIVGRKVGLTAKAIQAQLGVNQPDFGILFDDMAIPDGGVLRHGTVWQPKAEAEVAIVMARDLTDEDATADPRVRCRFGQLRGASAWRGGNVRRRLPDNRQLRRGRSAAAALYR